MKVLNFLFFILFIIMVSNVNFAKEIDDEYGSETQAETFTSNDEDIVKEKFNYNETYGPTPIFSIGGGLSMNPGGYSLDTKLDIPYKDDLYIGPHIYYADSDDETNFGLTGNIKKILESEDPKQWEGMICDPSVPNTCPFFQPSKTEEEIEKEVNHTLKSGNMGEIASKYPDIAALLWVLSEEEGESDDDT